MPGKRRIKEKRKKVLTVDTKGETPCNYWALSVDN
jgi:hypothetical protein